MAMTGAVVGSKCYPSQAEALDAFYSAVVPAQTAGATSYFNEFIKISGVWKVRQSISDSGAWITRSITDVPVSVFPACDPAQPFLDGMTIGWGIVAAMVSVSAVMMMRRGMRGG